MKKLINTFLISILIFYPLLGFAQDDAPRLVLPTGHTAPITSVDYSPDGKYIVSGSADSTVRLWDVATGNEVRCFEGRTEDILSVAFSPNGKYVVSGSVYFHVKLWEVSTGKEIWSIWNNWYNKSVSFSPDGNYIVISSNDKNEKKFRNGGILTLLEASSGKVIRTFGEYTKIINSVSFSPDGLYVLSGSDDKTIRLWDISNGKEVKSLSYSVHKAPVYAITFDKKGDNILAEPDGKFLKMWSVATGRIVRSFSGKTGGILSLSVSSDDKYVIAGCSDKTIKLWELKTGSQVCKLRGHEGKVNSVKFSPDSKYIVSGSDDKIIRLWDVKTGHEIRSFSGNVNPIYFSSISPDGHRIVYGTGDKFVKICDIFNPQGAKLLSGHKGVVRSVKFSPDGKYIISGSEDQTLKLWDASTYKEIRTFHSQLSGHRGKVSSVDFSPDGKYVVSGSDDTTVKIWDIATGKNIDTYTGHNTGIISVAFTPNGHYVLSSTYDYPPNACTKVWDVSVGKEIQSIPLDKHHGSRTIPLSSDSRYFLFCGWDCPRILFDIPAGNEIRRFSEHDMGWQTAAFSPDGNYIVNGHGDGVITLYNMNTGNTERLFLGHDSPIGSIAFISNGKYIISSSWDGTFRLWESSTGELLLTYVYIDQKDWIVTTPDGRFDGSSDGIKLLHYAKDNKSIPLDSLFDRFYTPNLVAQVISGKEIPNIPDIREGIQMPPIVRISSPKEGQVLKEKEIEVVVEATDQGGGIEDIRLYHNDKRIGGDERGMKKASDKVQSRFTISLVNGINTLKATAFSIDRTESHPYEVKIRVDIPEATSDMYIVAVGINSYKNSNYNLKYCVPDAQVMISTISEKGKSIFRNINLQTVFDEQATYAGIESALSRIEQSARPEDVFVFYYSGHGVMSEEDSDFYFVPYDVTEIYGEGMLKDKGLSAAQLRDISQRIRATKQLLIIDSCQSGKIVETFTIRGISEEKAIAHLARSAGITVIAATQTEQFALEYREIKHGLFTYALLQGMEGKADGSPKDNRITVSELSGYIQATIPELTEKYRGKPQYPNVYMRGQDFPIVMRK